MKLVERASGLLLHITCLPSEFGIGDLGPWSYRFVDILSQANQRYWNILPITPTSIKYGNSPYQATSAFAGNILLISPELLFKEMLLSEGDLRSLRQPFGQVAYEAVIAKKRVMLAQAYQKFARNGNSAITIQNYDFEKFCFENRGWLDDYALYMAICRSTNKPWNMWAKKLRDRDSRVIAEKTLELKVLIGQEKFGQFIFARQWNLLKKYCQDKDVHIIGDLPFYVCYESVDTWSKPELFKLDEEKRPLFIGGVPPDYFSKNGQRWGNPVYRWQDMEEKNFDWWMERIRRGLNLFDMIRLDHYRGFTAFWQIPASSKTAKGGRWIRAPSKHFFKTLKSSFPNLPFIAEDLGQITNSVRNNLKQLEIPGMSVLLFAFNGSEDNPNLPENHIKNSLVYTGTHDTNPVKGWFIEEASREEIEQTFKYLGREASKEQISHEFVRLALFSVSNLSIIPIQDVLNLGVESRMNHPGRRFHNWQWRVKSEQLASKKFENLAKMTENAARNKIRVFY